MIASLVMGILCFGIRYSFGIFFNSLEAQFGLSRAATSGIYSTYLMLGGILSIFGGWALDRYGPRKVCLVMSILTGLSLLSTSQVHNTWQIYITYSVLLALGTGYLFAVVNSTASRWFVKKRGLVVGITTAAGGIGQIIIAPVSSVLLLHFQWRIAFVILGIMVWIILIPVSQLMKRDPADIGLLPDGVVPEPDSPGSSQVKTPVARKGLVLREAYKVREFWFLAVMWLLSGISSQLVLIHVVPDAIDLNISAADATFIISLIGAGAILARIVNGRISDSLGRKLPAIFSAVLEVIVLISLIFTRQTWQFYVAGLFFGYGWGGFNLEITLLISDIFGLRSLGAIMGATAAGFSFGSAIGPAIGGIVFDATGSYSYAFAIAAFGMAIALALGILVRPVMAKVK